MFSTSVFLTRLESLCLVLLQIYDISKGSSDNSMKK